MAQRRDEHSLARTLCYGRERNDPLKWRQGQEAISDARKMPLQLLKLLQLQLNK